MEFKWLNESKITKSGNRIEITAPPKTDFFCGSIDDLFLYCGWSAYAGQTFYAGGRG